MFRYFWKMFRYFWKIFKTFRHKYILNYWKILQVWKMLKTFEKPLKFQKILTLQIFENRWDFGKIVHPSGFSHIVKTFKKSETYEVYLRRLRNRLGFKDFQTWDFQNLLVEFWDFQKIFEIAYIFKNVENPKILNIFNTFEKFSIHLRNFQYIWESYKTWKDFH